MASYAHDGYFDGISDGDGNITPYGQMLLNHNPPLVARTGDGYKLTNGGQPAPNSANWNPNTPPNPADAGAAAPNPNAGTSPWDPQGVTIGDNGDAYLFMRQYDPTLNAGKGGYTVNTLFLGNPNTAGFDWNTVAANTSLPASVLKNQYEQAQQQQASSRATTLAQGQWHFDSMSPYTGAVTLKNGANVPVTISLADVMKSDFATKFPGVSVADVQREVQSVNQQNWLDYGFTAPGTKNYRAYNYMSLTPGLGQTPAPPPPTPPIPPGTRPGDAIPGATPIAAPGSRGGPVIPGATPGQTPLPRDGTTPATAPAPTPAPVPPPIPPPAARPAGAIPGAAPAPAPLPIRPANLAVPPPPGPVPSLPDMRR